MTCRFATTNTFSSPIGEGFPPSPIATLILYGCSLALYCLLYAVFSLLFFLFSIHKQKKPDRGIGLLSISLRNRSMAFACIHDSFVISVLSIVSESASELARLARLCPDLKSAVLWH
jgi:hypothetical protein